MTVKEIMTPQTDVAIIDDSATQNEAGAYIRDTGYSHIPVYHDVLNNIVGVLNIKDVFNVYTPQSKSQVVSLKSLMIDVYCVPESKRVDDLMRKPQARSLQVVIVLNEFDRFSGIVTIEDIIDAPMSPS